LAGAKGLKAAVENAINGLAWVHLMAGVPSPTESPIA